MPVYYRREPPEEGLPLGNYAHARRALDEERHREYNRFMHEKEEAARQRREEIMRRQSPTRQPPQSDMYDHNQMSQHLREERRREYNDFLRRQEELELNPQRKPPTPLGGLPVGAYEQQRKRLQAERTREYRDSLLKQAYDQWTRHAKEMHLDSSPVHGGHYDTERPLVGSPRDIIIDYKKLKKQLGEERKFDYNRYVAQKENETHNRTPPTPPVGLNIPTEAERLRIAELRKRQYGADLRRQHQEQILNRAQNQVDMPVLDRRNQSPVRDAYNSPSVPPLGLDRRPPSGRWDPESYRQTNYAPVKRLSSPPHQANIGADDYSEYRRKVERDSRNSEYNQFLARKQVEDDARKQKMNEVRRQPAAPVVKGDYYDSESYDLKRQYLMEEKHKEYQNYLKKKSESAGRSPTPTNLGLPLSQNEYDSRRKHLELERNKEYNELLAKVQPIFHCLKTLPGL
ncbi:hypothetical protein FSP39_003414 [Pinctada imbricata]|uniref:Uncharacterized protein n=1 Tax=Pinctada imbricata TaxID=66713 RepID=A0AA88XPR4_PINIB|nr:hypothetical protein FSP39_003414 [Pinctada imbricata]